VLSIAGDRHHSKARMDTLTLIVWYRLIYTRHATLSLSLSSTKKVNPVWQQNVLPPRLSQLYEKFEGLQEH